MFGENMSQSIVCKKKNALGGTINIWTFTIKYEKKTDKETKAKRKQIQMIIKAKSPDVHKHLRKNMQLIWKKKIS